MGGLPFMRVAVVSDPGAIRRVLLDNCENYQKDWLQRRILSAGLSDGLLTAESTQWRSQRRMLAPAVRAQGGRPFLRRHGRCGAGFGGAARPASRRGARPCRRGHAGEPGRARAHDLLRRARQRPRGDPKGHEELFRGHRADRSLRCLRPAGRDAAARPPARRARPCASSSRRSMRSSPARRRRMAEQPDRVPQDLLTLLLQAEDPQTGARLSEIEVRSNMLTFISAGHETTANCLTWSLFLLSQAPAWRDRVRAEAEARARRRRGGSGRAADRDAGRHRGIEPALSADHRHQPRRGKRPTRLPATRSSAAP